MKQENTPNRLNGQLNAMLSTVCQDVLYVCLALDSYVVFRVIYYDADNLRNYLFLPAHAINSNSE